MVELIERLDLPRPVTNRHVWAGGELLEVDFLWRDAGLIVEVDAERYHATRWRRRQDAEKTARLREAGYVVYRFSDAEVAGAAEQIPSVIRSTPGVGSHTRNSSEYGSRSPSGRAP
jgi:hypothetical protein